MCTMDRIEKLILEQAERTPAAVAVEHNGARLTYSAMRQQAQQISAALRELGLAPGEAVGVCQERSLGTVPLLLGIWAAGGVVVPISTNLPVKMLEWVIEDSSPRIIVTDGALEDRIADALDNLSLNPLPVVLTDVLGSVVRREGEALTAPDEPETGAEGAADGASLDDTCYIVYTSGSEGRPKGVVGSHRSLIHYVRWQAQEFSNTEADRFSQIAPLSFDFSLKELLVPLVCGARVCIADRNSIVLDPEKFMAWVGESRITVMCCVPTLVRSILQLPASPADARAFQSVRHLLISGDILRWDDVFRWRKRFGSETALYNLYGPTESTVIKFFYPIPETKCEESANVPVGRPIEGADVLILDEAGRTCPPGELGEIVILSDWLARGYLNGGPAGHNRFGVISHDGKQTRSYRTGDLGRVLGSGNVELVGRKDRQVKIRGHRVELDGIESVLSEHADVRDVAVVVSGGSDDAGSDDQQVIACYFTANRPGVSEKEISAYARESLPPQVFSSLRLTRLQELPLTANGKVDRIKLKSYVEQNENGSAAQPRRDTPLTVRQRISMMWEELLSLKSVDLEANFFQLGGDSMTAIRLLRRLREEVHPEVKLGDVYEYPSVSKLSDRVESLLTQGQ